MSKMHNPPHPGNVLREYLPETMTMTEVAARLGVTRQALSAVMNGRAGISPEMSVRLAKALGTSPDLWLGLQMQYDLWRVTRGPTPKVQRLAA
jgi:antitoxin HigA-1